MLAGGKDDCECSGEVDNENCWLGAGVSGMGSIFGATTELFLRFVTPPPVLALPILLPSTFLFAMGHDNPRNLPRLATPTPHVRVVL